MFWTPYARCRPQDAAYRRGAGRMSRQEWGFGTFRPRGERTLPGLFLPYRNPMLLKGNIAKLIGLCNETESNQVL